MDRGAELVDDLGPANRARLARAAMADGDAPLESLLQTAWREGLWEAVLPLLDDMDEPGRLRVAEVLARQDPELVKAATQAAGDRLGVCDLRRPAPARAPRPRRPAQPERPSRSRGSRACRWACGSWDRHLVSPSWGERGRRIAGAAGGSTASVLAATRAPRCRGTPARARRPRATRSRNAGSGIVLHDERCVALEQDELAAAHRVEVEERTCARDPGGEVARRRAVDPALYHLLGAAGREQHPRRR